MALILNIDTTTIACSVVLSENRKVISIREEIKERSHASLLTVFIDEVIRECSIKLKDIDAVAISMGPGSYTGLRIGVSVSKGICYGNSIPLIAIPTLQALCYGAIKSEMYVSFPHDKNDLILCPMIDARRMDVFTALFDQNCYPVTATKAETISDTSFKDIIENHKIFFFGDGSEKCKSVIKNNNAYFIDNLLNSAKFMIDLAEEAFNSSKFVDIAYFEPYYLKDFIPTASKKNIITGNN